MENQENLKGSEKETKIVALVLRPDGSLQVKGFTRDTELKSDFQLGGSVEVSSKDFKEVPKHLAILFNKNFNLKPNNDAKLSESSSEPQHEEGK